MVVPRGRPRRRVPPVVIVVCWKWVTAGDDERWAGVSESDRAALEVALGLAATTGDEVTVVTVGGPAPRSGCGEALAVGATRAVRIDAPADLESAAVAHALAAGCAGADWVVCGDASSDRGSGSVPAFVAAELGAAQALGLVAVEPARATAPSGPCAVSTAVGARCSRSARRPCCRSRARRPGCAGPRCPPS